MTCLCSLPKASASGWQKCLRLKVPPGIYVVGSWGERENELMFPVLSLLIWNYLNSRKFAGSTSEITLRAARPKICSLQSLIQQSPGPEVYCVETLMLTTERRLQYYFICRKCVRLVPQIAEPARSQNRACYNDFLITRKDFQLLLIYPRKFITLKITNTWLNLSLPSLILANLDSADQRRL